MNDLIRDMTQKISQDRITMVDDFIRMMLVKKGYPHLAEIKDKVRFPGINITERAGWLYVFADNGTKQGDFIVAVTIETENGRLITSKSDFSATQFATTSLKWQDTNFSAVMLP
jgi:hypothetical protein